MNNNDCHLSGPQMCVSACVHVGCCFLEEIIWHVLNFPLLNQSGSKCLADLCGALHCDFFVNSKSAKTKCNPAAAARNRHLCEVSSDPDNYLV